MKTITMTIDSQLSEFFLVKIDKIAIKNIKIYI